MANNTPVMYYARGNDLCGRLGGAGGIGGLLARSHGYSGGSWSTHNCYHADGGGNITYLMTSAQGLAARSGGRLACRRAGPPARRQGPTNGPAGVFRAAGCRPIRQPGWSPLRNPYGRLLSSSGPLAGANRYRFASKEVNPNYPEGGGYYYFGYRFYEPQPPALAQPRPPGRGRGINLYGFVGNDPLNAVDPFGLADCPAGLGPGALNPQNLAALDIRTAGEIAKTAGRKAAQRAAAAKLKGDIHHPISKYVSKVLDRHPTLKGKYKSRDNRFRTKAKDKPSHNGYDDWQRKCEKQIEN